MATMTHAGAAAGPITHLSLGAITQGTVDDLKKILWVYLFVFILVGIPSFLFMRWDWLSPWFQLSGGRYPNYALQLLIGMGWTLVILLASCVLGFLLAIPIGLVQVTGPTWLAAIARGYCTLIRGTPLLVQLWLMYYGLGSIFPLIPEIRQSFIWPLLREGWPFALVAFTLNFAAYEGEIMRGAFAGVPRGELEAGRAFGMSPWIVTRRIWLPRAVLQALPTLAGEVVLQLKSVPIVATVTVPDLYFVNTRVRQDLAIAYEPLLLIAFIYMLLTAVIVLLFGWLERRVPMNRKA